MGVSKRLALMLLVFLMASCVLAVKPVFGESSVGNLWVERAPMPTASGYVQAVTVNGEIYAVTPTATYQYDPSTDEWSTEAPMPTSEYGFAIATYQNMIYVIGGNSGFDQYGFPINCTGVNQMYNPATDTWQIEAPMPTARAYLEANVVNGEIYLISGAPSNDEVSAGSYSSANEVYDPASNSWTTATSNPVGSGVDSYASAVFGTKIYFMNGEVNPYEVVGSGGPGEMGQVTEWYDAESNSWSWPNISINASPTFVIGAGAATLGTEIYVLGGDAIYGGGNNLNQIYDPETGNWTYGASMPTARFDFGVAVVNGAIYAIGGSTQGALPGSLVPGPGEATAPTAVNEEYFPLGYQGAIPSSYQPTPSPSSSPASTFSSLPSASPSPLGTVTSFNTAPEPFPTAIVIVSVAVAVAVAASLVYFKKHGRRKLS